MSLAGHYRLHPGNHPSIVGSRPVMGGARLGRLLRGQQGDSVVQMLGNVLTLCAHAQRRTARMALWAAEQQEHAHVTLESSRSLQLETARDHLRSMALDWPQRQTVPTGNPALLQWLAQCPVPLAAPAHELPPAQASSQQGQLLAWLESTLLHMPIAQWLTNYRNEDAFAAWCTEAAERAVPLQCLAAWHTTARRLQPITRTLDVLNANATQQAAQLRAIAQDLCANPDFALRPFWLGACAESGAWSRLRHRQAPANGHSAWSRLQARWVELLELAHGPAEPQTRLLHSGALPLSAGQAIAWCEMARGLLLHWVQLDEQHRVQDYRVLAPTEWNFHPDGALAHALTQLNPADAAAAWCLAVAYDPCVECSINVQEIRHA
jgi:hypothetical protein